MWSRPIRGATGAPPAGISGFISGKSDWGVYQRPGSLERMQHHACTQLLGCHLLDGAGHWVQQAQPGPVSELLIAFPQRTQVAWK